MAYEWTRFVIIKFSALILVILLNAFTIDCNSALNASSVSLIPTRIVEPPVDSKLILSSTAELKCGVSHDPSVPVDIYWTFNGPNTRVNSSSRVKILADGTLRIEQVRNTDVGYYSCRVDSSEGSASRTARLDVIELPHSPTNVRAELNVNGGLVNVSWIRPFDGNSPIVRYVVQMRTLTNVNSNSHNYDDEVIQTHDWTTAPNNISGSQNYEFLTNLKPAMTYQFRVSAINNVGEGPPSAPTTPPITLPAQPPNAAPVGVVGAPRSSTAITIQWHPPPSESHNGQLMGYIVRYKLAGYAEHTPWYTHNVTNAAQLSYILDDLIVWQNYEIQIAAYNDKGVGVYSPSIFVRTKEGRPASQVRHVSAHAVNSTTVQISWQSLDPQLINGINQGYKIQAWKYINETYSELSKETTVLPAPFPERSQTAFVLDLQPFTTYHITVLCFTSAGDGPKTDPPVIVETKEDLPEEVSDLKFKDILDKSVRVLWSPPYRINGVLLGYTLRYFIVGSNSAPKHVMNYTAQQNEAFITNLSPQTAYTFEINAWTRVGAGTVKSATIQSSIPPVLPEPPTHLAISNIGAFSVVLQFTPGFNGNASISKWIVESQLFKLRNANWTVIYVSTNHSQNDAIIVHNLRPYTEYRLRLSPVNVVGKSLESSEPSPPFQTLQALPAGPPMNVTLRTVSPTAIRVRWTPLPPESWHGHPRGYNVTWIEIDDDGNHVSLHSFISDDYHSHSYLITSLEEYSTYGVQVMALNDVGSSNTSRLIIERTNEAPPSAGPEPLIVKATSSATIVVEWGDIAKVDRNGIIQGYKVKYMSLKAIDGTQYKIIEGNHTRTTTLTELRKYTSYRISVCAFTHAGDGVYSQSLSVQTFEDTPGPPSNVSFPDVTYTTARIQWDIPYEPNGEIIAYKVSYKMSDEDSKRAITREFTSADRTHRFTDLRPETYYIFDVTAKTKEGWGKPAKLLVYTTNSRELPTAPMNLLISTSQISSRQVTINWTPGRDGYAPLRYYTVQMASHGGPWYTFHHKIDPTLRTFTITNLHPFTAYQFRIKATNDIGDSGWSVVSPITRTLPAPPDKSPLNVVVSPYTTTSVAVKWTEIQSWNGDEYGAGYRVQYCLITQQIIQPTCPHVVVRGKNATTVSIDNLERDQHYEIKVIPFNSQGDGPSSKAKNVYVGEAVPTGEPLNISTVALSSTEIKVVWSPPDKEKQNGQLMGYKIFYWLNVESHHKADAHRYRTTVSPNSLLFEQPREMMEIVPVTCESFILLDLLKWTNYSIQISAFNPAGDGPRSRAVVIQTKEDIPEEVGNLHFSDITMSQVRVSWSTPLEPNGVLLGYYITYETLIGDFSKQVKQKITENYLFVNGLKERVTYTFKVRAQTSAGVGSETVGNVTTGPQPGSPPPPHSIILTQTLTSVKLRWINPEYSDITGYLIEAKNLNKKEAIDWQPVSQTKNGKQDRFELSFTQLAPSSQYTFRIMSLNSKGVSEPSYPDQVIGSPIIYTPSNLELRARMPYYRESWFVILCACLSVVFTIMVVAVLCVRNQSNKYKNEATKGSQDCLSEVGFGLDDNIENNYTTGFEMRHHNNMSSQRRSNGTLSTTVSLAATKSPPRPSPGSITYSDDEEDDDDDDIKAAGLYESSGDSVTEKPSEMSSSGPDSESEQDDACGASHFVNHYANVNDTLRKGQQSWKRHAKSYVVPSHNTYHMPSRPVPPAPPPPSYHHVMNTSSAIAVTASEDSELDSPAVNLNGGRIIVNNMAGSRAPLPGFSSFV